MSDYPTAVKRQMVRFYVSLNERRRRYAAVEAQKLGHGGLHFISGLLKCDPKTIAHGIQDWRQRSRSPLSGSEKKGSKTSDPDISSAC